MKKTHHHKKVESLMWSKPEKHGARQVKWAVVNPVFVKLYNEHQGIMVAAGLEKQGHKVTWTSDYAGNFALPNFPKRERVSVQEELWKNTPQEPDEDSRLATALGNFATLQAQFEEVKRLYGLMKAERDALTALLEKLNAR